MHGVIVDGWMDVVMFVLLNLRLFTPPKRFRDNRSVFFVVFGGFEAF